MNFFNLFSDINLKEILQRLPDAVIVINSEGRIIWTNREAEYLFYINPTDEVDYYFDDIVSKGAELASQSASKHVPVIAGAVSEGREFFIEMNASQYEDQYIITVRDVTAMTKVLANAEKTGKLNKDKNIMLSKISNDFVSPIQSIIGFSNALSDGLGGEINEKQAKYVKIINKNASELLYFMNKFFEFSKAEATLSKVDYKTFDVVNCTQEVLRNNEEAFNEKNLAINFTHEELATKPITMDVNIFKTVLQNVIETSLSLTEMGSISITLSNPDLDFVLKSGLKIFNGAKDTSYLQISIKDTGVGLKESEIEDLFDPYAQLEKANKKNFVRNLNLGTAKTLLKKVYGTIWAESEIMKGTTFNIIMPIEKGIILEDE